MFNYDFNALETAAPVIQATYTALKEVETRSMDLLPTWRLPEEFLRAVSPRQKAAQDAVVIIRDVTTRLVEECKKMVEEEEKVGGAEAWARDYLNESNPSRLEIFDRSERGSVFDTIERRFVVVVSGWTRNYRERFDLGYVRVVETGKRGTVANFEARVGRSFRNETVSGFQRLDEDAIFREMFPRSHAIISTTAGVHSTRGG